MKRAWVGAAIFCAVCAQGTPAGATLKVYSPSVEHRELELEWRARYEVARSGEFAERVHKFAAGYGLLPRLFVEAYGEVEKTPAGEYEMEAAEFEAKVQFFEAGQYWLDSGALIEYEAKFEGKTDEVALRLLLQKEQGRFVHSANVLAGRELASGEKVVPGFNWSSRYRKEPRLEFGAEYHAKFSPFGERVPIAEQPHYAGPVAYGKLGKFKYDVGYLFGLTEKGSASGMFKWIVEYEIHF